MSTRLVGVSKGTSDFAGARWRKKTSTIKQFISLSSPDFAGHDGRKEENIKTVVFQIVLQQLEQRQASTTTQLLRRLKGAGHFVGR